MQWEEISMSASTAIRFENLSKTFGQGEKRVEAVKNLNLTIDTGQVYGFLGPNGAGKTTTIRMIMNLIRPVQGSVYVYGQDVRRNPDALQRVGALVEDATFYNFLSGIQNLEVIARTGDVYSASRIAGLLEQVGLADRAHHRVKDFSTGMKQRLGLAAALLNDPDLVILDEPTNGLDPSGIQETRHFIRALAHEYDKTVFLSSHLLTEVEQVCDRIAIINKGEIIREGSVVDLLAGRSELHIEAEPLDKAAEVLEEAWRVSVNSDWLAVEGSREDTPHLVRRLVEGGIEVYHVSIQQQTLEEFFLDVTADGNGADDD